MGCSTRDQPAKASSQTVARSTPEQARVEVSVVVDAPGASPQVVEAEVLGPIEARLTTLEGLRHISAGAREGQARLVVEFAPGTSTAQAMVVEQLAPLVASLPSPPRVSAQAPAGSAQTLRWSLDSEAPDPTSTLALHRALVGQVEEIDGVLEVDSCAPSRRFVIELEPGRLRASGLGIGPLAQAVRAAVAELPRFGDAVDGIASLRAARVPGSGTNRDSPLRLGELAAIRYGFGPQPCAAATAGGEAAVATVTVASPDALAAVERTLDGAALPPGSRLRRFGPADTRIALTLAPTMNSAEAAQLLASGFARANGNWLVMVGGAAEPCALAGLPAQLSIPGPPAANASLARSLWAAPGVQSVALGEDPDARTLWLFEPDLAALGERARAVEDQLERTPGLRALVVHGPVSRLELAVDVDESRLAALDVDGSQLALATTLAGSGVALGSLRDRDGVEVSVVMQLDDAPVGGEALVGLPVAAGQGVLPLGAVATISEDASPARICRRDGRRAAMVVLHAEDPELWPTLESALKSIWGPPETWAWGR